ncbi:MAG: NAD(P)/FAD-dependent oxidoreductase [Muribaculaceae bacterium]|nr:NAD(P)/FAD-dependent oxidoreductase [Muribaculaceae bacterium]
MEKLVVIGGGFAGINFISKIDTSKYEVKLIDRNNFHCFPPLFYQIASSGLDSSNICFPFRREIHKRKNITYHMGHVKEIDIEAKTVTTSYETISYDKLVIAAGTTENFFGMKDLDKKVFGIKTVAEASYTRDEILDRLERGAICQDKNRRRELLSFLVVGGGPSGVEIAGALGEMKKYILAREYPELSPDDVNITLVEGSDRILGTMHPKCSQKALGYLKSLMVNVRLGEVMKGYEDKLVEFSDGHKEYWETLIWTAGVRGEPLPGFPEKYLMRNGRIPVDEFNRVIGLPGVYALGDIACCKTEEYPNGLPQLAQPAIQGAKCLARNLNEGEFRHTFKYRDKGSMATVGKHRAVLQVGNFVMGGYIAWLGWMFIHLISILGMRNKVNVLLNWTWNYITYSTSLRLLLRPKKYPERRHWGD